MLAAWSLGTLNMYSITDSLDKLPVVVADMLISVYCYSLLMMFLVIVVILNVGKKNKLTVHMVEHNSTKGTGGTSGRTYSVTHSSDHVTHKKKSAGSLTEAQMMRNEETLIDSSIEIYQGDLDM
eukprot:Pgem_evm1s16957